MLDRVVREPERRHITGLARSTWWELERRGLAPRRIRIGTAAVGWRLSALEAWLGKRAEGGPQRGPQSHDGQ